jgi:hypothetical protein
VIMGSRRREYLSDVKRILTALRREGKERLTSNAIRVQALAAHKNYPCGPRNGEQ